MARLEHQTTVILALVAMLLVGAAGGYAVGSGTVQAGSEIGTDRQIIAASSLDADRRYDRIEELRAAGRGADTSSVSDDSYDKVEAHRLNWGR